ncbi:MAG: hypothetical protein IJZ46_04385 [Bacilli bacterium]|nr:hypothetical protein [Bacilli bacterium]
MTEDKKTIIYVDMDDVIASYDFGKPLDFKNKRPLTTNIKTLSLLCNLKNVELRILSVFRFNNEVNEKNEWLNKYVPFFEKDKRTIIPKESYPHYSSKELKLNCLKTLKKEEQIIFIEDDNEVLRTVRNGLKNVILYQDSELID